MCHGEKDSIPLMTYEQARPWATSIKEEVLNRQMPPWQAIKGFGEFKGDRGLTQEEIETLSGWAEGGAPEGNPKFLPETTGSRCAGWIRRSHKGAVAGSDVAQRERRCLLRIR